MIINVRTMKNRSDRMRNTMIIRTLRRAAQWLVISSLLLGSVAYARDYQIEVVLFENVDGRELTAGGLYYPKLGRSLRLGTEEAVAAGFVPLEQNLSLADNAQSIAGSRRYRLIRHLAWRQPGLEEKDAIPIRISLGETVPLYLPESIGDYENFIPASANASATRDRKINTSTVNGSITVHLGRFLHMNTQLVFTDAKTQQSFRLSQSRKMRSRELHYIDNPRFGILTRILPIEESVPDSVPDPEGSAPGSDSSVDEVPQQIDENNREPGPEE